MSHPLFFILLLILSLLFMNSNGVDAVNDSSTICPSHDCGGVTIKYPFWRVDDTTTSQYCGYPGFGLNCSDGKPIFTLPSDTYYVENIDYTQLTLTLADIDATNQSCPRARHNVTLDTVPLDYSPLDLNLSFYFNCTSNPSPHYPLPPIGCLGFGGRQSYVAEEVYETGGIDWFGNCEEKVVVTVMEAAIEVSNLAGGFGGAMNKGFVLNWRMAKDCSTCEDSDGLCGYSNTQLKFLCFCGDGTIRTNHCKDSSFDCGKFTNISYPFWGNGQPDYCGHPGFELDCQGDDVTMEIMNKEFLVIDIDRDAQILKVARTDLMESLCPDQYFNTSIDSTPFNYTSNDEVATSLLYNCPHMDDPGPYLGFVCSINNSPRNCYFVMSTASANELAGSCEVSVVVPILALAVQGLFDLGIQAVLNEGFEVAWMVDEAECRDCNRSGGRCGFDFLLQSCSK